MPDVLEEELVETGIGLPIDGQDGVAGTESGGLAGFEDLGHDVGTRVVHGPPAEVRAVLPPHDVHPIQDVHHDGQQQGKGKVDPLDVSRRR